MADSGVGKKKPQKMNGFALFMVENRKKWEAEGHSFPGGLRDVAKYADTLWRDMEEDERQEYKDKAAARNSGEQKNSKKTKPEPKTLGFRGPSIPVNVIELSIHGVGDGIPIPRGPEDENDTEDPARENENAADANIDN